MAKHVFEIEGYGPFYRGLFLRETEARVYYLQSGGHRETFVNKKPNVRVAEVDDPNVTLEKLKVQWRAYRPLIDQLHSQLEAQRANRLAATLDVLG